jgi:hypothetical protein
MEQVPGSQPKHHISEVEHRYYDEDPGRTLATPTAFDLAKHEASTRRNLVMLSLAMFGILAILGLIVGSFISATPAAIKLILGIVAIAAGLAREAIRSGSHV